jgi:4a-hydroxytetrahydrobiopterin dehydratase
MAMDDLLQAVARVRRDDLIRQARHRQQVRAAKRGGSRTHIVRNTAYGPRMDMVSNAKIDESKLDDWRKLGQGLHARYVVADFRAGLRFLTAVGDAADGHHPQVSMGDGYVDLKLISDDAVYRDEQGVEHVIEWVTQRDLDVAAAISGIAAEQRVAADPAAITWIELALDTAHAATLAPVWAALLTGSTGAVARGGDVRDATGRVPNLWFQGTDEHDTPRQRFHLDIWVAPEVADERIAAAVAAGGIITDASQAPSFTVIADQDGNKACICTSAGR